jgi:hypothetical protein
MAIDRTEKRIAVPASAPLSFERTFTVRGPADEVFDFLADNRNEARWNKYLARVEQVSPGAIGLGTRFKDVARMMGLHMSFGLTIGEYQRPRRVTQEGRFGPVAFVLSYSVEAQDSQAQVTLRFEGRMNALARPLVPLMSRVFQHRFDAVIPVLVELLERRA